MKRKYICEQLNISEAYLSMLMKRRRKISWQLAYKLNSIFPDKDMQSWKKAEPEQIISAFVNFNNKEDHGAAA